VKVRAEMHILQHFFDPRSWGFTDHIKAMNVILE
jgi:hypothetical protein